ARSWPPERRSSLGIATPVVPRHAWGRVQGAGRFYEPGQSVDSNSVTLGRFRHDLQLLDQSTEVGLVLLQLVLKTIDAPVEFGPLPLSRLGPARKARDFLVLGGELTLVNLRCFRGHGSQVADALGPSSFERLEAGNVFQPDAFDDHFDRTQ